MSNTNLNIKQTLTRLNQNKLPSFSLAVDIQLPSQGITAVLGESGCGKTTLLRCIAGLEKDVRGHVIVNSEIWQNDDFYLPAHQRKTGFVFQDAQLFSHMTVKQNLAFAVKRSHTKVDNIYYTDVITTLGIAHLERRDSINLSGGERQRVAIARALLIRPQLLLMDEPLASLDAARKREILPYLLCIQRQFNIPIVYVSHSTDEITKIASHVLIMEQGKVVRNAPINEVFSVNNLPLNYAHETSSIVDAKIISRHQQWHLLEVSANGFSLFIEDTGQAIGDELRLRIHASDVSVALKEEQSNSIINKLAAVIRKIDIDDNKASLIIKADVTGSDSSLVAKVTRKSINDLKLKEQMTVWLQIKSVAILT
ncbi:molybdenum ABC transporter ATP-binding protein [Glaciecola sp. MH2013]|uniref:molybdenum ABC transporter ATP-binding protein n=1 Tax=Glaciecola sp. MH2013 TaxID=2785524 RepID=UPI0018A09678|nr:molybdenum ABC transporter ATP-binding protein [Glaciecola sp. MH2013]MBF7073090.1 molybdenum ABC transporter ATP-binding protein [Glaciecola sp. MH2013]